ncbi:hypothetical protein OPV22_003273 [Ensete ventricosum]|uniref:Uncharacterized protein n=1 Tax=Ensete ventricosum TaxID=4639 RepID=A0AAV8S0C6_ENSVE|nr:hypothetical protein OPV22_003273 [Ensete ventricosum]
MRAVRGSVVRLKHISLAKASTILSRFAANENAARRDVAAYVRRASAAFDELVGFRHEIRATRKRSELEKSLMDEGDEERNRKKRRKRGRDEQVDGEELDFLAWSSGSVHLQLQSWSRSRSIKGSLYLRDLLVGWL